MDTLVLLPECNNCYSAASVRKSDCKKALSLKPERLIGVSSFDKEYTYSASNDHEATAKALPLIPNIMVCVEVWYLP